MGKYNEIAKRFPRLLTVGEEGAAPSDDYQLKVREKINEMELPAGQHAADEKLFQMEAPASLADEFRGLSEVTTKALTAKLNSQVEDILLRVTRTIPGETSAAAAVRAYNLARDVKDLMDDWKYAINLTVEAAQRMMLERMEQEGLESIRPVGQRAVFTNLEPYAQVEDREAVRQWAMADPDLVPSLQVNWNTLNSLTKKMLEAGENPPPGVKMWCKVKVQRGAKP